MNLCHASEERLDHRRPLAKYLPHMTIVGFWYISTLSFNMASTLLDMLGFSPHYPFAEPDWKAVPDVTGVYVIFDRKEMIYVGMAGRSGKGSLRRLRDHSSGQVVNMFVQYLLFDRILIAVDPPKSPSEARNRCRAYIRENCGFRFLVVRDKLEARRMEKRMKEELQPTFNRTA